MEDSLGHCTLDHAINCFDDAVVLDLGELSQGAYGRDHEGTVARSAQFKSGSSQDKLADLRPARGAATLPVSQITPVAIPADRLRAGLKYRNSQARKRMVDANDPQQLIDYQRAMDALERRKVALDNVSIVDPRKCHYFAMREHSTKLALHRQFQTAQHWINHINFSFLDLYNVVNGVTAAIHLDAKFSERTFWLDVNRCSVDRSLLVLTANLGALESDMRSRFASAIRRSLVRSKRSIDYQKRLPLYQCLDAHILVETHAKSRRQLHSDKYVLEEEAWSVVDMKPISDKLDGFVDIATSMKDRLFSTLDSIEGFSSQLYTKVTTSFLQKVEMDVPSMLTEFLTHLGICIRQLYTAPTVLDQLLAVYSFGSRYTTLQTVAAAIWKYMIALVQLINDWKESELNVGAHKKSDTTEPEFEEQDMDIFHAITEEGILGVSSSAEFASLLATSGKYAGSANNIVRFVESLYRFICFLIERYSTGTNPKDIFVGRFPAVAAWVDDVQSVMEAGGVPELAKSVSLSLKVAGLHNRGMILAKDFYAAKPPPQAIKIFGLLLAEAQKLSAAAASASQGLRVPPVVVWLQGDPGCGKTNSIQAIVKVLCAKLGIEDAHAQIFQRPSTSDYWNGYANQLAMLIDDFGQSSDETDRRTQALDLLYAASTNPYILDMADVGSKGCFSFTSRILFITTNLPTMTNVGLVTPKALERRIDVRATVQARPQFAKVIDGVVTPRVDPEKLAAHLGKPCAYNAHAVEYHTAVGDQTLVEGPVVRSVESFTEFVDIILAQLELKQRFFQQAIDNEAFLPLCVGDTSYFTPEQRAQYDAVRCDLVAPQNVERLVEAAAFDAEAALEPLDLVEQGVGPFDPMAYFDWTSRRALTVLRQTQKRYAASNGSTYISDALTIMKVRLESFYLSVGMWISEYSGAIMKIGLGVGVLIAPLIYLYMQRRKRFSRSRWHTPHVLESGETRSVGARVTRKLRTESGETRSVGTRVTRRIPVQESGDTRSVGARVVRHIPVQESGETKSVGARVPRSRPVVHFAPESGETVSIGKRQFRSVTVQESFEPPVEHYSLLDEPYDDDIPNEQMELARPITMLVEQDCPDHAAQTLIDTRIYQQLYFFNAYDKDGVLVAGSHCMALAYRSFWIPYHTTVTRAQWHTIHLIGCSDHKIHVSNMRFLADDPSTDCAIVEFTKQSGIGCFADLRKFFVTEADLSRNLAEAILVSKRFVKSHVQAVLQPCRNVKPQCMSGEVLKLKDGSFKPVQVLNTFYYATPVTAKGDCGSPLILMNQYAQGKIMGFHYLGIKDCAGGMSSAISREYVMAITRKIDTNAPRYAELQGVTPCYDLAMYNAEGFEILGTVAPSMGVFDVGKSNIRKSPFFECFGPSTQLPAMLRRTNGVDPMALAQKKNFGPTYSMDGTQLCEIVDYVTFWLRGLKGEKGISLRLLSLMESLNGVADDKYCDPINTKTSAGYPWRNLRKGKKTMWVTLDANQKVCAIDPMLQAAIDHRIAQAKQGIVVLTVWIDTLKDERRSIDRVLQGKTRMFMNGPFDFTIVFRMYFGSFISMMMHLHSDFECALGINPHSPEWDTLLRRLNEVMGDNYIAGDFSNYDGSILAQLVQAVTHLINQLYNDGPENARVREVLMADIYNAIHIDNCTLYKVFRGNPSGNPLTTVMNSLVNTFLMLYAWKQVGYTLEQYETYVRATNFGDDNVLKVHPYAHKFTMSAIAAALRPIGITYTPASKNGVEYDYIPITEVTFLKRKFVRGDNGLLFAPLDEHSRDEMMYWFRDGNDHVETYKALASSHMIEAVHYGEQFYRARADMLVDLLARQGITMPSLSKPYDTWLREWYEDTYTAPTYRSFALQCLEEQGLDDEESIVSDQSERDIRSDDETVAEKGYRLLDEFTLEWSHLDAIYTGLNLYLVGSFPMFPSVYYYVHLSHRFYAWNGYMAELNAVLHRNAIQMTAFPMTGDIELLLDRAAAELQ